MKLKLYSALIVVTALFYDQSAHAVASLSVNSKPAPSAIKDPGPNSSISAMQFLSLSPEKLQEITGKKMNLLQKVEFRILQHKVKKLVRRGRVVNIADVIKKYNDDDDLMKVAGILLGAILGPVGVIIALIIKENGHRSNVAFRWSLIGLVIWLVWFLILVA